MAVVYTLVIILAIIVYSIDSSSPFEGSPDAEPDHRLPRNESAPPTSRHLSPDRRVPLVRLDAPGTPAPPAKSSPRVRSRSPPPRITAPHTKIDFGAGHQYDFDQIQFIRLTPYWDPRWVLELRKYTFPINKLIFVRDAHNVYVPMPIQEQIVLSTTNGDVYALLENGNSVVGIYSHYGRKGGRGRVKINMESSMVTQLTKGEIENIPVGRKPENIRRYRIEYINHDSNTDDRELCSSEMLLRESKHVSE